MSLSTLLQPATDTSARHSPDRLKALVADDLERVNALIGKHMQSRVRLIPTLGGHLVASGGKRVRPMLTLAAARLCGYGDGARHIGLATCVEFIHTATLLHDDVVDESDLRRGNPTANAVFGNQASVLVGDFLFSRAFQLMVADGNLQVLEILSTASAVIAEGEVHQLTTQRDLSTDETAYLDVIGAKTAALFRAAAEVGAVVAERGTAAEVALRTYGEALGVAFQLVDDALDYSAQQAQLGKTIGDDFREGKVTLPVLLAHTRGDEEERAFWQRTIGRGQVREGDLAHAVALMNRHNALTDTVARAQSYANAGKAALAPFPADDPYRQALEELIDFCVERAH